MKHPRQQRGVAMVEFVICSPVLLLLIYGTAELGRALVQYSQLADAVRDADRYLAAKAIPDGSGVISLTGPVVQATQNLVVYGNIAGSGSVLLPALTTAMVSVSSDTSNNVAVSVTYPYQSLIGGTIPNFLRTGSVGTTMSLQAFTSMRAL